MVSESEKARRRAAVPRELERREREEETRQRDDEALHAWRRQEPPTGAESRVRLLRDAAFALVRRNSSNNPGAALMRQELARRFPDVSSDEYAQVYFDLFDECLKLLDEALKLAAMHWEQRLSEVEALRQLSERYPGFSADTYQSALDNWRQAFR
jgi:hypothetical protein